MSAAALPPGEYPEWGLADRVAFNEVVSAETLAALSTDNAHALGAYCLGAADAYRRWADSLAAAGDAEAAEEAAGTAAYARERAADYYNRYIGAALAALALS